MISVFLLAHLYQWYYFLFWLLDFVLTDGNVFYLKPLFIHLVTLKFQSLNFSKKKKNRNFFKHLRQGWAVRWDRLSILWDSHLIKASLGVASLGVTYHVFERLYVVTFLKYHENSMVYVVFTTTKRGVLKLYFEIFSQIFGGYHGKMLCF